MTAVLASSINADADIAFDATDFNRVRSLIRAKAGIDLHPGKQNMVYGRLSRRLRECGHKSFRTYLDALQQRGGDDEWQEFINCLTTNLTSFFREAHHFEVLADALRKSGSKPCRIWSCAASTGEEPYSILMTAVETLGANAPVRLEATDIDTRVLATARDGVYSLETVNGLGEARLRRFFQKGTGAQSGKARVKAELRQMVQFQPFNLLSPTWNMGEFAFVFCRNVMIYFDRPTQRQVLERLHRCLQPGGLLFAGHAENFAEHRDLFELVGRTVYRKVG